MANPYGYELPPRYGPRPPMRGGYPPRFHGPPPGYPPRPQRFGPPQHYGQRFPPFGPHHRGPPPRPASQPPTPTPPPRAPPAPIDPRFLGPPPTLNNEPLTFVKKEQESFREETTEVESPVKRGSSPKPVLKERPGVEEYHTAVGSSQDKLEVTPQLEETPQQEEESQNVGEEETTEGVVDEASQEDWTHCVQCDMSFTTRQSFRVHTRGMSHAIKKAAWDAEQQNPGGTRQVEEPKQEVAEEVNEDDGDEENEEESEDEDAWKFCEPCNLNFTVYNSYMLHIRGIGHCQKAADFEKNKPPKPKKQKKKEKSPAKTKSEVEMERVKSQAEEKKKQETSSQWYCSCCDKKMTSDLDFENHTKETYHKLMKELEDQKLDKVPESYKTHKSHQGADSSKTQRKDRGRGNKAPAWKDSSPAPANSKKAMPSAAGKNINYEDFQEHDLEPEVDPDLIPTDMDGNFLCVLCNVTCNALPSYEAHIKGQKHLKKKRMIGMAEIDESVEGLDEMDLTIDYEQKFGNIQDPKIMAQEKLDRCEKPLIGLQYIVECQNLDQTLTYLCDVCEAKMNCRVLIAHLDGFKHKRKFMKSHFPSKHERLCAYNKSRSVLCLLASEYAEEIEEKYGRRKIRVRVQAHNNMKEKYKHYPNRVQMQDNKVWLEFKFDPQPLEYPSEGSQPRSKPMFSGPKAHPHEPALIPEKEQFAPPRKRPADPASRESGGRKYPRGGAREWSPSAESYPRDRRSQSPSRGSSDSYGRDPSRAGARDQYGNAPYRGNPPRDPFAREAYRPPERDDYMRERDSYASERDSYHQRDPHRTEKDPYARDRDLYGRDRDPYARGQDPFARERDPYGRERDPYARERDPYARDPDPYARDRDPYAANRDPYSRDKDPYSRDRDPYSRDRDPYARNKDPYAQDPYKRDKDPYAADPYSSSDPYSRDPYKKDPFAKDPYSQDPYTKGPYSQDPYTKDPYSQDPYTKDPYSSDPYTTTTTTKVADSAAKPRDDYLNNPYVRPSMDYYEKLRKNTSSDTGSNDPYSRPRTHPSTQASNGSSLRSLPVSCVVKNEQDAAIAMEVTSQLTQALYAYQRM